MKKMIMILLILAGIMLFAFSIAKHRGFKEENIREESVSTIKLNNGVEIPCFGIGTYSLPEKGDVAYNSVLIALKNGYTHIDTAHAYQNEKSVGIAIKDSGVRRESIWVTSKLWPTEYEDVENALDKMLSRLGLDYIDLVYLHQPYGNFKKAYSDLLEAKRKGKVRAIGISNFDISDEFYNDFISWCEQKPQIMQIECHPYAQRKHWQKKLAMDKIVLESWFPLGGRDSKGAILTDSTIRKIADKKGKSPAQVIIRWHIQKGFSVIPGSSNPKHIMENIDIFSWSLTDDEMKEIDALDKEKRVYERSADEGNRFMMWEPAD